ncbi:hypothetical protein [Flavobacterium sp. T12S277]|uniref:hypothetical protein n=1 Tax=Flavobacterium sp. T12S277 TaxID=3402752 RepID=UPI003AE74DDA
MIKLDIREMSKRKGLIYDSQKYFSRFLKYEFKEDYSFDTYCNFKYFDKVLDKYSVIIFVIYSEEELLDFIKVYRKEIPLIICSFNNKILVELGKIDEVLLLDTSKLRAEIVTELKTYFNCISH